MNVTRNVVVDLLPLYAAGEVSQDTRVLVEEYLASHPELAPMVDALRADLPSVPAASADVELRGLYRVRRRVALHRWIFGLASFATAMLLTTELTFENGHLVRARLLLSSSPIVLSVLGAGVALLWVAYFAMKRRG